MTLDEAIREHRESVIVAACKAHMEGSDGDKIRRELDEADRILKERIEAIATQIR